LFTASMVTSLIAIPVPPVDIMTSIFDGYKSR
ncbi:hypothetical protein Q604_UNBC11095G0001, partial [human gut metagenome]